MELAGPPLLADRIAVEHLTGPLARNLLDAAIAALDAELLDFSVEQFVHDPGASCSVTYPTRCRWRSGEESIETLTATTDLASLPEGVAVLRDDRSGLEVGVWRYPFDPQLPGLADVVLPSRSGATLGAIRGAILSTQVVAYRAGRRAVLHVAAESGAFYVKVVRPHRCERLVHVHAALAAAGVPVPPVLAADGARGIVVLAAMEGATLRSELLDASGRCARSTDASRSTASSVAGMIERIQGAELDGRPARRAPLADADSHARTIIAARPDLRDVVEDTMGRARAVATGTCSSDDASARSVVHGDLHDAQIMVSRSDPSLVGGVVGLLDLDDVGMGDPGDDWASLIGHGIALACHAIDTGSDPVPALSWVDAVWEQCDSAGMDLAATGARAAAVVLSLATGPLRFDEGDPAGAAAATELRVGVAAALARQPAASPTGVLENSHDLVMCGSPPRGTTDASPRTTEEP